MVDQWSIMIKPAIGVAAPFFGGDTLDVYILRYWRNWPACMPQVICMLKQHYCSCKDPTATVLCTPTCHQKCCYYIVAPPLENLSLLVIYLINGESYCRHNHCGGNRCHHNKLLFIKHGHLQLIMMMLGLWLITFTSDNSRKQSLWLQQERVVLPLLLIGPLLNSDN